MIRKIPHIIICVCLLVSLLCIPLPVSAQPKAEDGTITVDTVDAAVGDTVIVPIRIDSNPGIMAITVSVTYDKNALSFEKYIRGYLSDYTVADHPDKSLIRFVNCEQKNRYDNGIMVSFQFTVKENASAGLHPISIDYKAGDFADWDRNKPEPIIVPGGVKVSYNGKNCAHKNYGDWKVAAPAGCTTMGKQQRHCTICGHTQIEDTPALGHSYANTWTIDRPASKEKSGIMSRHCIRCDATTDLLSFTLKESEQEKLKNEENAKVDNNAFIEKLVKEQLPETREQDDTSSDDGNNSSSQNPEPDPENQSEPDGTETDHRTDDFGKNADEIVQDAKTQDAVSAVDIFFELVPDLKSFLISFAFSLLLFLKFILV